MLHLVKDDFETREKLEKTKAEIRNAEMNIQHNNELHKNEMIKKKQELERLDKEIKGLHKEVQRVVYQHEYHSGGGGGICAIM